MVQAGTLLTLSLPHTHTSPLTQDLKADTDIDLENIVYYKDDTHYFVMTAKKDSLLRKGVLINVRGEGGGGGSGEKEEGGGGKGKEVEEKEGGGKEGERGGLGG